LIRLAEADLRVTLLDAGRIRLDGGAMFGVVPRVLWERQRPPDERHRIELAMNVLLVEDGRRRILVDCGAGAKWDARARDIYGFETKDAAALLAPAGLRPDDIDVVVNTHLHFDHAGGNTERAADGTLRPAFPKARYVVQRGDLEFARRDNERIRASYHPESYEPIARDGGFQLVEGDVDLFPGVRLSPIPGHTPWLQSVIVDAGEAKIAFLSDLVPTASHVPYPWIMGYDLDPLTTLAVKKRILPQALRESWRIVLAHDARLPVALLEEVEGKLRARAPQVEA
jgi:glyoxylase-like metal-dependent hydrolase (beta-lactamase superfamily II)